MHKWIVIIIIIAILILCQSSSCLRSCSGLRSGQAPARLSAIMGFDFATHLFDLKGMIHPVRNSSGFSPEWFTHSPYLPCHYLIYQDSQKSYLFIHCCQKCTNSDDWIGHWIFPISLLDISETPADKLGSPVQPTPSCCSHSLPWTRIGSAAIAVDTFHERHANTVIWRSCYRARNPRSSMCKLCWCLLHSLGLSSCRPGS